MARHPKTTLWMLIKVVLKKRYVRVEKVENGRHIPVVKGTPLVRGTFEPGNYYLRYTLNGKRKWESVGGDLNIAIQEPKARRLAVGAITRGVIACMDCFYHYSCPLGAFAFR
jgi:hypothetical protein